MHGGELRYAPAVHDSRLRFRRVAARARECLHNSPYHALKKVSCYCDQGVLFLRGRAGSFFHKQLAQEAVARVKGVTQVVNEIEVR